MGHKPSNIFQMDRPESGGADHKQTKESSGVLKRAKQDFAQAEQAKHKDSSKRARTEAAEAPVKADKNEPEEVQTPAPPALKLER